MDICAPHSSAVPTDARRECLLWEWSLGLEPLPWRSNMGPLERQQVPFTEPSCHPTNSSLILHQSVVSFCFFQVTYDENALKSKTIP